MSPDGTKNDALFGLWYNNNYKGANQHFVSALEGKYFKHGLKSGEWNKVSSKF